jgi:autotransporter translocation and assembly factor TamB
MPFARLALLALRLLGTGVGVVLALAFALLLWALDTREGLRFAVSSAQSLLGQQLVIGSASGRLLHDFELRDVRYTVSDGTVVAAARLHLKLVPRELMQGRLHLSLMRWTSRPRRRRHRPRR